MRRGLWVVYLAVIISPPAGWGRSRYASSIDKTCQAIKEEFRESKPLRFSGPDPWLELEPGEEPDPGDTVASVYSDGPRILMVILTFSAETGTWNQMVRYCFHEDGAILKRERYLQSKTANVELDEYTWYRDGRVVKDKTHHHALEGGKEDESKLEDPDAPTYWSTRDLPFPIPDLWDRWAALSRNCSPSFKTAVVALGFRELSP